MLHKISILHNTIQYYAWGSKTAIPELLGIPNPEGKPMAELWMGAHPKAPSRVAIEGRQVSLIDIILSAPQAVLGEGVVKKFGRQLPFLFKVLAAAEPLSIQVHPTKEQAEEGFERENKLGIPLDAPERNYRDNNHKPEMLCALTPFEALKGFRPVEEMLSLVKELDVKELLTRIRELKMAPCKEGLKSFFTWLMKMGRESKVRLVKQVVEKACGRIEERREFYWITELGRRYPGDIGVLSPILLNLIMLQPAEAVFLPAGELHAYLRGTGLEIMANSDNVLRGGLTSKHIDVEELLRITEFRSEKSEIIKPKANNVGEEIYNAPAEEFRLSRLIIRKTHRSPVIGNVEILLCLGGKGTIRALGDQKEALPLSRGVSILVPATCHPYEVSGQLELWKATVPP